jgi:two-component system CheB/CheR fusion protein
MSEAARAAPLKGLMVLLVEDHDDARALFRSMLEYAGAFVVAVATVDDAVHESRSLRIDVVLTDIGLRRTPGTWFVEDGRLKRYKGVPIIAVTGRDMPTSLRAMFDAVIEKPVDADTLTRTIRRVTRR